MTLFFALLAIVFASAALMAIFQWGAQNHETQQLRRLRATILKELDQCLKP